TGHRGSRRMRVACAASGLISRERSRLRRRNAPVRLSPRQRPRRRRHPRKRPEPPNQRLLRSRSRAPSRNRRNKRFEMPKRTLHGVVVSDKQDKTVVVRVERRFTHPTMKKTIRRSKKYHAHDEANTYAVGDMVWIEERRPISKLKCWEVVRGEKKQKVQ